MDRTAHVRRVIVVLLAAIVAGLVFRRLMRPDSFGEPRESGLGSLAEIMGRPAVYQGQRACAECHSDIFDLHEKDVHQGVECEDCHGAGDRHAVYHREHPASASSAEANMPKEYTLEGCLFCHRQLVARPRDFPQIEPAEHYRFLHVNEPGTRCVECHSPHEPLFLLTRAANARLHPIVYECNDCHDTKPQASHRDVADHPVIFVCADCHPKVAADFAEREHGFLRCTACHLFHRENETAGRIYKNGNRRFCLLCHEKKPFKAEGEVPMIVSSDHVRDTARFQQKDPAILEKDPKACLGCHIEYIHGPEVIRPEGTSGESDDE